MPSRTLQFSGHGDLKLRAETRGSEDAPPVVLLHGGGQTRHSWTETARALAAEGWRAISVDLRGHGESDWDPEGSYDFEAFAADVTCVAEAFDRLPVLVGASLGGIASMLAIHNSQRALARALVLVDVAAKIEPAGAARIVSFMLDKPEGFASLEEVADAIAAYNPQRPRPTDLSGLEKNLRLGSDGRYRWHWDPAFMTGRPRPGSSFEGLDAAARSLGLPTLLVRGRQSDLLSPEGARHFLELVPHARYADVSGAGHMVAGDRNDAFTRAILDFLQDQREVHAQAGA